MSARKQVRLWTFWFSALHGDRWFWYSLNVSTGLFAIRSDREYVTQEDFMKAVRKVADSKKLESKLDYKPV